LAIEDPAEFAVSLFRQLSTCAAIAVYGARKLATPTLQPFRLHGDRFRGTRGAYDPSRALQNPHWVWPTTVKAAQSMTFGSQQSKPEPSCGNSAAICWAGKKERRERLRADSKFSRFVKPAGVPIDQYVFLRLLRAFAPNLVTPPRCPVAALRRFPALGASFRDTLLCRAPTALSYDRFRLSTCGPRSRETGSARSGKSSPPIRHHKPRRELAFFHPLHISPARQTHQ